VLENIASVTTEEELQGGLTSEDAGCKENET